MSLKSRKKVIWGKLESTYNTDSSPAAVDALLVGNFQPQPFQSQTVERVADRSKFGNKRQLHVGVHGQVTFDIELVGSGTLGTAPAFGKLFKACGCLETIVASTSVAYTPDTDGTDSLTIAWNVDGNAFKLTGCRGSFQITMNDLQVPVIRFTFMGVYTAPASGALGVATGEADFQFPKPVSRANTTVSVAGESVVLRQFTLDGGQQVEYFDDEGVVEITDRTSGGSIQFLSQLLSSYDWYDTIRNDSLIALSIDHHQVDAYRCIIASSTLQLTSPQSQDDRGRVIMSANLSFEPSAALDDEWELRFAAA